MCSVIFTNTQHLSPQSMAPGAVEVSHVAKVNQSSFPASGAAESSADWRFPHRFAPFDCRLKKLDPAKNLPLWHYVVHSKKRLAVWCKAVRKTAKGPLTCHISIMEIFGFMNSMSTSCTWMLLSGRITSKNITKQGENPPFFPESWWLQTSHFSIMGFGGWRCFWCETTAVLPSFTKDSTSQKKTLICIGITYHWTI